MKEKLEKAKNILVSIPECTFDYEVVTKSKEALAILDSLIAELDSEGLVEKVAIIFGGGFFGVNAVGWEHEHAEDMQKVYREKAKAALEVIKG